MAKITTGSTWGLTKQQFMAAEHIFNGKNARQAARLIFDCRSASNPEEEDPKLVEKYAVLIRKWMKEEQFQECYKALIKEFAYSVVGNSLQRLAKQVDDEKNAWLANKAANDILNRLYTTLTGENENEIVVRVENMPSLGEPDSE